MVSSPGRKLRSFSRPARSEHFSSDFQTRSWAESRWPGALVSLNSGQSGLLSHSQDISVNETTQEKEVAMLQPFTRKDLMIRSLPDRIHDCHQMKNLYPNMPKDTAFGKYYSSPPETVGRQQQRILLRVQQEFPLLRVEIIFPPKIFFVLSLSVLGSN